MSVVVDKVRQEAVLAGAAGLAFFEAATAHGSTLSVALQGAIPLVVGVFVRSLVTPTGTTPTQEVLMADLSALTQAVTDLTSVVSEVQGVVSTLRTEANPQSDVDPIVSAVQSATAQLQQAVATPPAA